MKRRATSRQNVAFVAIVVAVLVVSAFVATRLGSNSTSSTTSTTSTSSTTTSAVTSTTSTHSSTSAFSLGPTNNSELADESPSGPFDSLDPHYGFFTVDVQFAQVFQGLVQYNGSDYLHVVPSLANSWVVSPSFENYTFHMRANTWFSNKDPINAYTAWFSFVRVNYMNAPTTVGFSNYNLLLYNGTTAQQNVVPWGLWGALESVGIPDNEGTLVGALNQMLTHFDPAANATQYKVVTYPHQALVVLDSSTFRINLIQPYSLFLLALPLQWGAIVDPSWIDANGGVGNNTIVPNFNSGGGNKSLMPGSGPYEYASAAPYTSIVLDANLNYWAMGVSGLSSVLQPPKIPVVVIKFGSSDSTLIRDFGTNKAQISFETTSLFNEIYAAYQYSSDFAFKQLLHNVGASTCDIATGLNTKVFPTNITDFRLALVHAVNYSQMLSSMYTYDGVVLGTLFQPPVPPGWGPTDNPDRVPLYQYNLTLAEHYLNQSGFIGDFYTTTPAGTVLGDRNGTELPSLIFPVILPQSNASMTLTGILSRDLALIGVNLNVTEPAFCGYASCSEEYTGNPYPFIGVGWCGDWADPVFQQFYDLATPVANEPAGTFTNSTLFRLLTTIPFEANATQQVADSAKAWAIYTQLAGIIQSPQPDVYFFVQPYVQGVEYSPFQFSIFYNMLYYQPAS